MAAGNLGIELEYVARITGRYTHEYMALAHEMLTRALGDSMHLKFDSYQAIQSFQAHHEYLTQFLKAHKEPISVPGPPDRQVRARRKKNMFNFALTMDCS